MPDVRFVRQHPEADRGRVGGGEGSQCTGFLTVSKHNRVFLFHNFTEKGECVCAPGGGTSECEAQGRALLAG